MASVVISIPNDLSGSEFGDVVKAINRVLKKIDNDCFLFRTDKLSENDDSSHVFFLINRAEGDTALSERIRTRRGVVSDNDSIDISISKIAHADRITFSMSDYARYISCGSIHDEKLPQLPTHIFNVPTIAIMLAMAGVPEEFLWFQYRTTDTEE